MNRVAITAALAVAMLPPGFDMVAHDEVTASKAVALMCLARTAPIIVLDQNGKASFQINCPPKGEFR